MQQRLFDPALKQFAEAFRPSDPRFPDPAADEAWRAARRAALDVVLAAVAGNGRADAPVLRGSVLLRTWYGAAAREPGDLDFVVPGDCDPHGSRTAALLDAVADGAEAASTGAVRFAARDAVSEDIWTYERVPGRRLVLPWEAEGTPGGVVQLDFVFGEYLPVPAEPVRLDPLSGTGTGVTLPAVTPELSLAWKLLWLVTDMYPQAKDLFDAVVLAENCTLGRELLRDVLVDSDPYYASHEVTAAMVDEAAAAVDWRSFDTEHGGLRATAGDLAARLNAALAPTFAVADPSDAV
ncbi:nucleotidyl transferase AbiEii/AbiGii toxin family protein [Kitasatospora paranensis]|uniref:Nucleotidyl transferase AbiEii/AbiGii toxin family protein n=1 Tax=Kitasatospora paranensis TaxID=258053 RepID=A0ABW2G2P4_9ACTN